MNQWRVIRSMRMPNKVHHVGMREFFSSEDKWGGGGGRLRARDRYISSTLIGGKHKLGDHGPSKAHSRWFILFYHVWGGYAWMKIHWDSIWLRAWSHVTSHYTWRFVTTLHDFGGVFKHPLDTSFGLSQFHGHGSWLVCEVALELSILDLGWVSM